MVQIPLSPHSKIKISRPASCGICPQKSAAQSLTVSLRGLTRSDFGRTSVPALRLDCAGVSSDKNQKSLKLAAWGLVKIRVLVKGVTSAAKHVFELVPDKVFNRLAGRAEVFARIEFLRIFRENLADAGGHGQAQVGVNIDLRATHAPRDFDV